MRLAISIAVVLAPAWLVPGAARASEGVIQIGAAAVPYTIATAGSYRLVSNLTVGIDTSAIIIADGLDGVEIDLNGFSIVGANDCTYNTTTDSLSCASGDGSYGVNGPLATGVSVRNGFVRGMGQDGITLGERARVERVVAFDNQGWSVRVGAYGHVSGCQVSESLGGIRADQRSTVTGNVVTYTTAAIQLLGNGAVVTGNTVASSAGAGIALQNYTVVLENVVTDVLDGISSVGVSLTVGRNVVAQARSRGIRVGLYSSLRENVVYSMGALSNATLFIGQANSVVRNVFFPAAGRPNVVDDPTGGPNSGVADNLSSFGFFDVVNPGPTGTYPLGGNCCESGGVLASEYTDGFACQIPD